MELLVKFATQIYHENTNTTLDAAYLAHFGIDINIYVQAKSNLGFFKVIYMSNLLIMRATIAARTGQRCNFIQEVDPPPFCHFGVK